MASWQANNNVAITSKTIPFEGCSALAVFGVSLLFLVKFFSQTFVVEPD
jgi:hypothetical protein